MVRAEASVDPREDWQVAQTALCQQLGQRMTILWNNGNGKDNGQEQPKPEAAASPKEHWCGVHKQEFKKRNGPVGEFYSHQIKGTMNGATRSYEMTRPVPPD